MNELQLINDCKNNDRKAQKQLYERYARKMYAICLRYSTDAEDAKDLVQDGFIKIFDKIKSYEGRGSFEGWMKRLFVNLALENIRRRKNIFENSDQINDIPEEVEDLSDSVYSIPENVLMEMIAELPTGYATVFNLYAIEDYSHKQIADSLGISEGTSRSQYARARNILQEKLLDYQKKKDL